MWEPIIAFLLQLYLSYGNPQMSFNRWMVKLWYICPKEYYSAANSNESLIHVATCTNPWRIILIEKCQFYKVTHCMIPFIYRSSSNQVIEMENSFTLAEGLGWGLGRCWFWPYTNRRESCVMETVLVSRQWWWLYLSDTWCSCTELHMHTHMSVKLVHSVQALWIVPISFSRFEFCTVIMQDVIAG